MPEGKTTIEVTTDAWSGLNQLKQPGDTFDDVVRRLLQLEGANVQAPEDEEDYVSGDVVLARIEHEGEEVLRPVLKLRDKRASEAGDYEVVYLSKLNFGADSTNPRARGYISGSNNTFSLNDEKVVELSDTGFLDES